MKGWLWFVLLLPGSLLAAESKKLQGYVLNAGAFRKIQTYCVDTHNLPPDQVKIIDHFVSVESKPKGLLTKLPWSRREGCQDHELGAILRMEFPHDPTSTREHQVKGVLLVFRPGSPSPIYETPAVTVEGEPRTHSDEEEDFTGDLVANVLEYSVLDTALRMLVHDWLKMH